MDAKLKKAVEIFDSLGWGEVTPENVLTLPLGTVEQQKVARVGLEPGKWHFYDGNNQYVPYFSPEKHEALVAYALRLGVTQHCFVQIYHESRSNKEIMFLLIQARGAKFARQVVSGGLWRWQDKYSSLGQLELFMRLINECVDDFPQNERYLETWTTCAAAALGFDSWHFNRLEKRPPRSWIEKYFAQHIRIGLAQTSNITGFTGFAKIITVGVAQGLFPREEAITLLFTALESAPRPGDRNAWVDALWELKTPKDEITHRSQILIPVLSLGDSPVVSRLAPILIENAAEDELSEIITASFSAATKKARKAVLTAALKRECPPTADDLTPWLVILLSDPDKNITTLAAKLAEKWNLQAEPLPAETTSDENMWQSTPPLWQVPDFIPEAATPEKLTALAAEMMTRPAMHEIAICDIVLEQFLCMANTLARYNQEETRTALRGINSRDVYFLRNIQAWVNISDRNTGGDDTPVSGRDRAVIAGLGTLPCLLSTPSKFDLSITIPDLLSRLERYQAEGTDVLEADLYLTLTRLDINTKTKNSDETLKNISLSIKKASGKYMDITAGKAIKTYLNNPLTEPPWDVYKSGYIACGKVNVNNALPGFPNRLEYAYRHQNLMPAFPLLGDGIMAQFQNWTGNSDTYHARGLVMRQIARRATPFSPAVAVNFLAATRDLSPRAAEDTLRAISEAWSRGLLQPGIADIQYLDWRYGPPTALAALATEWEEFARMGLLPVIWPLLDALIGASLENKRLLPGTTEIIRCMHRLLPEVIRAVETNRADREALALPNTRSLAARSGNSLSVTAARELMQLCISPKRPLFPGA